jgi:1-acyl-sn-glycerol-3-phosphate acyltransferase
LRFARPVAKDSLFGNPVVAWTFHQWGAVAVDRENPNFVGINNTFGAFLKAGNTVNVFTEGTRVKTETRIVRPPKRTAHILALRHGLPIVPLAIAGVAVDDERNWFGRGKQNSVVAVFGEPMHMPPLPEGDTRSQERFILSQARERAAELHDVQQQLLNTAYEIRESA